MVDYTALITSEHSSKPKFMAWAKVLSDAMSDCLAVAQSLNTLFDVDTAVGAQLDAVGVRVGQPRVVPDVITLNYFGFDDTEVTVYQFGELTMPSVGGRFYELGDPIGSTVLLGDPEYRTAIRARIARNQYDGSLAALEQALSYIFGVTCSVTDKGDRRISITISRQVTAIEQALITGYDLLPRVAGVAIAQIEYATPLAGDMADASSASATVSGG
jgi:hypothetical protein